MRFQALATLGLACMGISLGSIACGGAADAGVEEVSEEALTSPTLSIAAGAAAGTFTATDAPVLTAGAQGGFDCTDPFARDGALRVTCARGTENLEIIYRASAKTAIAIHRPKGTKVDKRAFFTCKVKGRAGSAQLPATLECTGIAPRSRNVGGHLGSALDSDVAGIDIGNTHKVGSGGLLLRGMAPHTPTDFAELSSAGVGAVLLFKNQTGTGTDVADEMQTFRQGGMSAADVLHIPFEWQSVPSFETSCKQTLKALRFIDARTTAGKKVFFHCTVGEDRTGYLAGVQRLLTEQKDAKTIFAEELCERGYGSGNPLKPFHAVVQKLDAGLTPLFVKMAFKIQNGELSDGSLPDSACDTDPATDPAFTADTTLRAADYRCGTATAFTP